MYKVIKPFVDLQDGNYKYDPVTNNIYPREGLSVLPSRIKELASKNNKQGEPLIEEIKEDDEETPKASEKSQRKSQTKSKKKSDEE